jgi:hypothetical protein
MRRMILIRHTTGVRSILEGEPETREAVRRYQ